MEGEGGGGVGGGVHVRRGGTIGTSRNSIYLTL